MVNNLNIAHYPGTFLPTIGGVELIVHNLANEQVLLGHNVSVITHKKSKDFIINNDIRTNYKIISPLQYSFGISRNINKYIPSINPLMGWQIKYFQLKNRFDIWHFNYINENSYCILNILKEMRVPTVVTYRGADIQISEKYNYGKRRASNIDKMIRKNIINYRCLTATSESVKKEYIKLGVRSENIKIIPNFIDYNKFESCSENIDKIKLKYKIDRGKIIVLSVGRNHPKKGYDVIPSIIKELLKYRSDFIWIIVGKDCERIYEKANNINVEKYLRIIGEIGKDTDKLTLNLPSFDLIKIYKASDVFCFPTRLETFGNVFLEAMASETPIVTTNAPGAIDNIFHEQNGLVNNIDDVNAFAFNINRLLNERVLRDKIVNCGKKRIKQFDLNKIAKAYIEVYKESIEKYKS